MAHQKTCSCLLFTLHSTLGWFYPGLGCCLCSVCCRVRSMGSEQNVQMACTPFTQQALWAKVHLCSPMYPCALAPGICRDLKMCTWLGKWHLGDALWQHDYLAAFEDPFDAADNTARTLGTAVSASVLVQPSGQSCVGVESHGPCPLCLWLSIHPSHEVTCALGG